MANWKLHELTQFKVKSVKIGDTITQITQDGEIGGRIGNILVGYRGKYKYYEFYLHNGLVIQFSCSR